MQHDRQDWRQQYRQVHSSVDRHNFETGRVIQQARILRQVASSSSRSSQCACARSMGRLVAIRSVWCTHVTSQRLFVSHAVSLDRVKSSSREPQAWGGRFVENLEVLIISLVHGEDRRFRLQSQVEHYIISFQSIRVVKIVHEDVAAPCIDGEVLWETHCVVLEVRMLLIRSAIKCVRKKRKREKKEEGSRRLKTRTGRRRLSWILSTTTA